MSKLILLHFFPFFQRHEPPHLHAPFAVRNAGGALPIPLPAQVRAELVVVGGGGEDGQQVDVTMGCGTHRAGFFIAPQRRVVQNAQEGVVAAFNHGRQGHGIPCLHIYR